MALINELGTAYKTAEDYVSALFVDAEQNRISVEQHRENVNKKACAVDIEAFARKFQENYNFLYENHDNVAGYDEAKEFCKFGNCNDVCEKVKIRFSEFRHDFISSDREAAAFGFTCDDFGLV